MCVCVCVCVCVRERERERERERDTHTQIERKRERERVMTNDSIYWPYIHMHTVHSFLSSYFTDGVSYGASVVTHSILITPLDGEYIIIG